jgi:ferredoxin
LVPKLEVEGAGTFDTPEGKRLVLAIEEDAGVDILHRCGAYAKCTTCRVEYLEGEPEMMTQAEREVLENRNLLGQVRLSCQAVCDHDMKLLVLTTVTSTGLDGAGNKPEPEITPPPSGRRNLPERKSFSKEPQGLREGWWLPRRGVGRFAPLS